MRRRAQPSRDIDNASDGTADKPPSLGSAGERASFSSGMGWTFALAGPVMMLVGWWCWVTRLTAETEIYSHFSVHPSDDPAMWQSEVVHTCMPSVTRPNQTEYLTNAVRSWREQTKGSESMARLTVFNMEIDPEQHRAAYRLRKSLGNEDGPWLTVRNRLETPVPTPRKLTHGDSLSRSRWRSKEAWDYAEVVEQCLAQAAISARFILIVQDDVIFTPDINRTVAWIDENLSVRRKVWCSASFFDFAEGNDLEILRSSNMVARLWEPGRAAKFARYAKENYDASPVDWLADHFCKRSGRLPTFVRKPNPVRHRGAVSSFADNKRDGLLT